MRSKGIQELLNRSLYGTWIRYPKGRLDVLQTLVGRHCSKMLTFDATLFQVPSSGYCKLCIMKCRPSRQEKSKLIGRPPVHGERSEKQHEPETKDGAQEERHCGGHERRVGEVASHPHVDGGYSCESMSLHLFAYSESFFEVGWYIIRHSEGKEG